MTNFIEKCDNLVRHKAALGRHQWLRDLLRGPYHRLINWHGGGISVKLGGCVDAKLPPELSGKCVETYESCEFQILRDWCRANSNGAFIDVGCSIGYYTCAALFSSPSVQVTAIDSDLDSLKVAQRLCAYADLKRLTFVQGMISDANESACDYAAAAKRTACALAHSGVKGVLGATNYRNLDLNGVLHTDVPVYRLDNLLRGEEFRRKPLLVKVDVEGAEWFVLNGLKAVLKECSTVMLLSVHPTYLPNYGKNRDDIVALLSAAGYGMEVLGTDHEEHWLCKRLGSRL